MAKTDDRKSIKCSFCGKPQSLVNRLIAGNGSYICDECVRLCMSIIEDGYEPTIEGADGSQMSFDELPKPADIRKNLDDYVIGQERAMVVLVQRRMRERPGEPAGFALSIFATPFT